MERELATKAPRTQGGAESHSGQRAGVAPFALAPFALQMQATVADAWAAAASHDAPAWRGWHQANGLAMRRQLAGTRGLHKAAALAS